jgi:hypothetical protein
VSLRGGMIDVGLAACTACLIVSGITPAPYNMWAWCGALSGLILLVVGAFLVWPEVKP